MFYVDLFSVLARHKVNYLMIGSLAVSLHGVAGVTVDVLLFSPVEFTSLASRADVLKHAVRRPIDMSDIEHLQRIKKQ